MCWEGVGKVTGVDMDVEPPGQCRRHGNKVNVSLASEILCNGRTGPAQAALVIASCPIITQMESNFPVFFLIQ